MHDNNQPHLNGWKEIAEYLGCSVRTAQNWEKQAGLPVRRVAGSVLATREEVDQWLSARAAGAQTPSSGLRGIGRLPAGAVTLGVLLAALGLLWVSAGLWRGASLAAYRFEDEGIRLITEGGLDCGFDRLRELDPESFGVIESLAKPGRGQVVHFVDLDGDDDDDAVFAYSRITGHGAIRAVTCEPTLWGPKLRKLWEFQLQQRVAWNDRGQQRVFDVFGIHLPLQLVQMPTGPIILGVFENNPFFPTALVQLSAFGELQGSYWHPGRIRDFVPADLNQDGELELYLGGINNPHLIDYGGAGFVARLRLPLTGEFSAQDPFGFEQSVADKYILFPINDLSLGLAVPDRNVNTLEPAVDRIAVGLGGSAMIMRYVFDSDLTLQRCVPIDAFKRLHEAREREGKLDHRFDVAELANLLYFEGRNPDAGSFEIQKKLRSEAVQRLEPLQAP